MWWGCRVREEEREILGWCLTVGEVPACVAAVPVDAWSGPAAVIRGLLVELQSVDVRWAPVDLYLWLAGKHAPTTEIGRSLLSWLALDEVLLLPAVVPGDVAEVAALCRLLEEEQQARVAFAEALDAARARAERVRSEAMAAGCNALRRVWDAKGTEDGPLRATVVHPAWLPHIRKEA